VDPAPFPARLVGAASIHLGVVRLLLLGPGVTQLSKPCIFCGKRGNMTKQHVLPNRLKALVPRVHDATEHTSERLIYDSAGRLAVALPARRVRRGHLGGRQLRIVCQSCNTGWIRAAEEEAFAALCPLILGVDPAPVLQPREQFSVATMAATIFCMIDMLDRPNSAVTHADRLYLSDHSAPPPHWHIFLGRTDSPNWRTRYFRHTGIAVPLGSVPRGEKPNSHAITVGLGCLVLHTVMDQDGPLSEMFLHLVASSVSHQFRLFGLWMPPNFPFSAIPI
jgi:hypothetical protein